MFKFLKKKEADNNLYAPVNGTCIQLDDVADNVFSSRMMGDGAAFQLKDRIVCAPCDGKIVMIAETKHAFGLEANNGLEVLIHVGLDTVNLNGQGLKVLRKQGDSVKKGDPVIEVDMDFMKNQGIDLTTPMIVTNGNDFRLTISHIGDKVTIGEEAIITKED